MNNKIFTYTSTGRKLYRHPEVIQSFKNGIPKPVSIQLAPTSRCNLRCKFCSNANRVKDEDLSFEEIKHFLTEMKDIGAKTVENSGGGDPTVYHAINKLLPFEKSLGYEVGMISNGVRVYDHLTDESLSTLKWLRISTNSLDYVDKLNLDIRTRGFTGTLGFSFVWDGQPNSNTIRKLFDHVKEYSPSYVRVVTNCLATVEEQERNNEKIGKIIESWGEPFFYQPKHFIKPERCWWCYVKPFVLHDGWVYPCSSVVLNTGADGTFHETYRWVRMIDLPAMYKNELIPYPTGKCDHCVFFENNMEMKSIIQHNEMENFV